jgi:hypothetical protein
MNWPFSFEKNKAMDGEKEKDSSETTMAFLLDRSPPQTIADLELKEFIPAREDIAFMKRHKEELRLPESRTALPSHDLPQPPPPTYEMNPQTYFLHPVFRFVIQSERQIQSKAMEWIQKRLALVLDLPPYDVQIVETPQAVLEGLETPCGPNKEKRRDLFQEWPDEVFQVTILFRLFSYQTVWDLLAQDPEPPKWKSSLCSALKTELNQLLSVTTDCGIEPYLGLFPTTEIPALKIYEKNPISSQSFVLKANISGKNLKAIRDLMIYVLTKRIPFFWPNLVGARGIKMQGPFLMTHKIVQGGAKTVAPPPPLPELKCPMHKVPAEIVLQIGGTSSGALPTATTPVPSVPVAPLATPPPSSTSTTPSASASSTSTTSSTSSASSTSSSSSTVTGSAPSPITPAPSPVATPTTLPAGVQPRDPKIRPNKVQPASPDTDSDTKEELGREAVRILDSKKYDPEEIPILEAQIKEMNEIIQKKKEAAAPGRGNLLADVRKGATLRKTSVTPKVKVSSENEILGKDLKIKNWETKNKGEVSLYLDLFTKKFRVDYEYRGSDLRNTNAARYNHHFS